MDTLTYLTESHDTLGFKEKVLSSKTPQPKRKFSEDVEKKIITIQKNNQSPYFIGICGGQCSGKSTIADYLASNLKECLIIREEDFFKSVHHRRRGTEDAFLDSSEGKYTKSQKLLSIQQTEPSEYDYNALLNVLSDLKEQKPISLNKFDRENDNVIECTTKIAPSKIIIVEGQFILANKELRAFLNLTLYVEADDDVRLGRILLRENKYMQDNNDALRNFFHIYEKYLKKSHEKFVVPLKKFSDVIIPNYEVHEGGEITNFNAIDFLIFKLAHDYSK